MADVDFATKLDIVTDYYGVGTIWDRMDINGLSADQINAMYNALPSSSFTVDLTPDGTVLGRNYTNPFELPVVPGTDFDSNIPGGSYGGGNTFTGNIPANLVTDPTTGLPVRQTAGPTTGGGLTLPAIADRISLAVAGVNIGAKLGIAFDRLLYSLAPNFWNEHLPSLNPETWNSLVGVNPVGDFFLRTLFGIGNNQMTGYISEDVLAYYYQMLRDAGVFDEGTKVADYIGSTSQFPYPDVTHINIAGSQFNRLYHFGNQLYMESYIYYGDCYMTLCGRATDKFVSVVSRSTITGVQRIVNMTTGAVSGEYPITVTLSSTTYNGTPFYYSAPRRLSDGNDTYTPQGPLNSPLGLGQQIRQIGTIIFDGTISEESTVPGTSKMPGSTQYPPAPITGTTPSEVKQQLKDNYPDLFDGSVSEKTMQDDGSITDMLYVPIPWVTTGIDGDEATTEDEKTQTDTEVDPTTGEQVLPTTPTDEPTQPPATGEGSTPVPALPSGSASSLWAVYNPSQAQLNSFGAWLWSSDFVEQLKKLFADPMQAIIGVHKVFAIPHTGGSQNIKCGYLDSGVASAVVTSQYTTVDCGSASLREYFGNVFDYDPFTKVSIFLPFIGIVPLNTADVMRSTVSVKYKVDVITGACLAEVSISRDGGGGILYTYGGSAIVTYPVSSGSYVGAVQAALSTAIGIGSAIATGGASLGASAGMILGGLSHAKTQVQHSGQFSGSSGAMGGKKPYLIISRPQTRTPSKIGEYKGIPSNAIHKLSSCTGFVKVNEVHIKSKTAYDNEIQEIESLLKSGVIF